MLFALDKNSKKTYIDEADENEDYFCPLCCEKLILKKGTIRRHHFSHKANSICVDCWNYDTTDRHMDWQNQFPLEFQEIVKEKNNKKHTADVLCEEKKTVIEFQHMPLSSAEFDERNDFFNLLGYKVIWIFDVTDEIEEEKIENYKDDLYKWSYPKRTFKNFLPKENPMVELYFETYNFSDIEKFYTELIKVTWAPEDGFKRFATDGELYTIEYILGLIVGGKEKNKMM